LTNYLASSEYIDWEEPAVRSKAAALAENAGDELGLVRKCFEFVRDEILHSADYKLNPVTCAASEVLRYGTGYCYAKSHLLAALLRANGIRAGLCYQRLTIENDRPPYCLHGLNAVFLPRFGWYRVDARGNKPGVDAEFCPPVEKLAFPIRVSGESDLPEIWPEPLSIVTKALRRYETYEDVARNLPDIELVKANNTIEADT